MKVKSKEEWVENYLIGVIQGTIKTKRYWMKKGYDESHAIKNAVKYAIGQISAGLGGSFDREYVASLFTEMAGICQAFANMLNSKGK